MHIMHMLPSHCQHATSSSSAILNSALVEALTSGIGAAADVMLGPISFLTLLATVLPHDSQSLQSKRMTSECTCTSDQELCVHEIPAILNSALEEAPSHWPNTTACVPCDVVVIEDACTSEGSCMWT